MLIVGINGHPDKNGSVANIVTESLVAAQKEARFYNRRVKARTIHLVDVIKHHHDGKEESLPKWIRPTFDLMQKADGYILGTPVNWFDKSDRMHTFISYLTGLEMAGFALEGKVAAAVSHCHDDGGLLACIMMMAPMNHMGCIIPPYCLFYKNKTMADRSEVTEPKLGKGWMEVDHFLVGANVTRQILAGQGVTIDDWGTRT
jgi:multimeric flavodoxin WrbA